MLTILGAFAWLIAAAAAWALFAASQWAGDLERRLTQPDTPKDSTRATVEGKRGPKATNPIETREATR